MLYAAVSVAVRATVSRREVGESRSPLFYTLGLHPKAATQFFNGMDHRRPLFQSFDGVVAPTHTMAFTLAE